MDAVGSVPEGWDPEGWDPEGSDPEGSDPEGSDPEGSDPEGSDEIPPVSQLSRVRLPSASRLPAPADGRLWVVPPRGIPPGDAPPRGAGAVRQGGARVAAPEPEPGDDFLGSLWPGSAAWSDPRPRLPPRDPQDGAEPGDDFLGALWGTRQLDSARATPDPRKGSTDPRKGSTDLDASASPARAKGWLAIRRNVQRAILGASHAFQPSISGGSAGSAGSAGKGAQRGGVTPPRLPAPHLPATFAQPLALRRSVALEVSSLGAEQDAPAASPAGRARRRPIDADEREERASDEHSAGSASARPPHVRRARGGQNGSQRDLLAKTRLQVTMNRLRKNMPAAEGLPPPKPSVFRRQGSCAPAAIEPPPLPLGTAALTPRL